MTLLARERQVHVAAPSILTNSDKALCSFPSPEQLPEICTPGIADVDQ